MGENRNQTLLHFIFSTLYMACFQFGMCFDVKPDFVPLLNITRSCGPVYTAEHIYILLLSPGLHKYVCVSCRSSSEYFFGVLMVLSLVSFLGRWPAAAARQHARVAATAVPRSSSQRGPESCTPFISCWAPSPVSSWCPRLWSRRSKHTWVRILLTGNGLSVLFKYSNILGAMFMIRLYVISVPLCW